MNSNSDAPGMGAMQRSEKINYAKQYCCELVAAYPAITGLVLGGSVARGNDLPISDLDLWCFVDEAAPQLPIGKHYANGVYVDIEQYPASLLRAGDSLGDAYFCGYLHGAVILFDRTGDLTECHGRVRARWADGSFRQSQLAPLTEPVERNYREFARSVEAGDARETCRSSIFAAWCLSDYVLAESGLPPGGARGLARLRAVRPRADEALVDFEGSTHLGEGTSAALIEAYLGIRDESPFFQAWIEKVRWMFANGYGPDAFHALWIALGLQIKGAKTNRDDCLQGRLTSASQRWLEIIGWDQLTAKAKVVSLRQTIEEYCHPASLG